MSNKKKLGIEYDDKICKKTNCAIYLIISFD